MFETGKLTPLNSKPMHVATTLHDVLQAAYAIDERGMYTFIYVYVYMDVYGYNVIYKMLYAP
jgi:hypothetical protein